MEGVALTVAKGAVGAIAGIIAYLWGPWDALIIVLVAVVTIDYITGLIKGAVQHKLSSRIGFRGLARKVAIFAMVALASLLDKLIPSANSAVRAAVCTFYIANEGLSILENVAAVGVRLPKSLKKLLLNLRDSDGSTVNADGSVASKKTKKYGRK